VLTALVAGGSWHEVGDLALAFGLSSLIGLEREVRDKDAGLRTHASVGTGAALFLLVGKYGFADVLGPQASVDPSRVAAGVVTGIGFLGGGLIFVRGAAVRGLTTASTVWVAAAVGMASAAGLVVPALAACAFHLVVVLVYPAVERVLPHGGRGGP
jgi:putative Mg2+ transporter-C (MgtC) family protein